MVAPDGFPAWAHTRTGDLPGDWHGLKAKAANSIGTEAFAHCGAEQTETTALATPTGGSANAGSPEHCFNVSLSSRSLLPPVSRAGRITARRRSPYASARAHMHPFEFRSEERRVGEEGRSRWSP